jgi:hypothetical protein
MTAMPSWLKITLATVVSFAILYVLISPLPELDAAGSIRSALLFATFTMFASFLALVAISRSPATLPLSSVENILNRICVRLC